MKISALDLQSVKSAGNTNFRGLRSSYDKGLNEIYKFYAPAYDRSKYSLLLQLCPVKENGMGGFEVDNSEIQPFIYLW